PQDRAVALLRSVAAPEGVALADGRLVRLGAAASQHAGVSSALELYPLSLDPVRALRLARQGLASAARLTVDDVRDRVRARFPQVTLPDRPALDQALNDAEVAVVWNVEAGAGGSGAYERDDTGVGGLSGVTSGIRRLPTRTATGPWSPSAADADPHVQAAADLEGRLQRSLEHGGFLALRVPTSRRGELRRELARFTAEPYGVVPVDLERWFLDELRTAAANRKISWDKLVAADGAVAGSLDHSNLRILTRAAAERVELRVLAAGARVLAWNPGVLVRYGELAVVDRLRARAGLADSDLQTLWLVVFGSTVDAKPLVDGQPVPVLGASEWVDITDVWLTNRHRQHPPTGTDAVAVIGHSA
ncbi:MAG: hypothetical protein M3011_04415, partial [Actinomycetota bacterium]|nr:hypothetical protein [Actinomycetota bacterium]